jgi:AraC-like DNA-binding protein
MNDANNLLVHRDQKIPSAYQLQVVEDLTAVDSAQALIQQDGQSGIFTDLFQYAAIVEHGFPVYCIGVPSSMAEMSFSTGAVDGLNASSVIILRPGDEIPSAERSAPLRGIFVFFTRAFLHAMEEDSFAVLNLFLLGEDGPVFPVKDNEADTLRKLFSRIFQMISDLVTSSREGVIRHLFISLLLETQGVLSGYQRTAGLPDKSHPLLYHRFKQLVVIHAKSERSMPFYAGRLMVSQNYLYKIVKLVSAVSPKTILDDQIVKEAKKLLKQSCLSVGAIADTLNFPDLFVFSKFFKKQTGVSPSVYRRDHVLGGLPLSLSGHKEFVETHRGH